MNENKANNIFNIDNYLKHLFAVLKTYPRTTFFILASECLFRLNDSWTHLEYPLWWRQLFSITMLGLMFKYGDWRPEKHIVEAIIANNTQEIQRLIQNHPWQVNITSLFGYTPLHYACRSSVNNDIFLLLLECGANPNALSNDKGTPIHCAVSTGSISKLEYLIQYGVSLDIQDRQGKTPLHWAVDSNLLPSVTFLVEHGADLTICDENGKTPLDLCRGKSEWEEIFNYLNRSRQ
jgi:hypothetical protein